MITLNVDQLALIAKHNANSKLNSFLASNPECEKLVNQDRMDFVRVSNNCETEMTKLIQEFDGKKCFVTGRFSGKQEGVIKAPLMRTYNGRTFQDSTRIIEGSIWLFVVTPDKYDSHCYDVADIEIID